MRSGLPTRAHFLLLLLVQFAQSTMMDHMNTDFLLRKNDKLITIIGTGGVRCSRTGT